MAKNTPAEEVNENPEYDTGMLNAFEYFLSQDKTQNNIIQSLINDYQPKLTTVKSEGISEQVEAPGSLSLGTIWKLAKSFLKAPRQTYKLLSFYKRSR